MEGQSVSVYGNQAHESLIHERSCTASPNSPIPLNFGWSTYRAKIHRLIKYNVFHKRVGHLSESDTFAKPF